ncbi:hypothetical protein A2U01_0098641 [Trifolium medium]|nr:hypothetical protein [Trifolium medium]
MFRVLIRNDFSVRFRSVMFRGLKFRGLMFRRLKFRGIVLSSSGSGVLIT